MRFVLSCSAALALVAGAATAQDFPARPIKIIVPNPPGGGNDFVARTLADKLRDRFGQPVVVENRAGASGGIGADAVAKSPPDGYTLLVTPPASLTLNRHLFAKMPYDPDAFAPVSLVAASPGALVAHPGVPADTVAKLVEHARANPAKVAYASQGNATIAHLAGALFESSAGVQMVHVPYKGTGPMVIDLVSGQINASFDSLSTVIPNVKAGKVRMIGLTAAQRTASAPEFPTLAEQGLTGYEATGWFGFATGSKVPTEIVTKLNTEMESIIRTPEMAARLLQIGSDVVGGPPEVFRKFIASEAEKWGRVIREANIKPE